MSNTRSAAVYQKLFAVEVNNNNNSKREKVTMDNLVLPFANNNFEKRYKTQNGNPYNASVSGIWQIKLKVGLERGNSRERERGEKGGDFYI